jgi:hypothetical protein
MRGRPVTKAVLDIVTRTASRLDEIHLVTSCVEPCWVSSILVDSASPFEVLDYEWAWEIDSKTPVYP